jgi:transcriptional regulatory protein RtcR
MKEYVVIGMLGVTLDAGSGPERWERWRPTVALCSQEDLLVGRLELLYQKRFTQLARQIAEDVALVSPETTVNLVNIEFNDAWELETVYTALYNFARQYQFQTEKEDYLVHITTGSHVMQICMFLLTEARYFPGKLLQTSPPTRKRGRPDEIGEFAIIDLDLSKYDTIASRFNQERRESITVLKSGIETRDLAFNQLIEQIEQVALHSTAPILLMGPTGAGKSQLAKRIYELRRVRHLVTGRFVEVNCATLRGDTAMSTLFGHHRGAFTGAIQARPGLLRAADKGILFLDEIGELGLDEQAMLLRALEEQVFLPMGADTEVSSHFQLIAGTNRDLLQEVLIKRFREDLLARINLWTFRLPGLRARVADIAPNLDYELERAAQQRGYHITISKEAREQYLAFATSPQALWTGNFRDLNASVTRMATLALGGRISQEVVVAEIQRLQQLWQLAQPQLPQLPQLQPITQPQPLMPSPPVAPPPEDLSQMVLTDFSPPATAAATAHPWQDLLPGLLSPQVWANLDYFDQVQLATVIAVCRQADSLSTAGRQLFSHSRQTKKHTNDADRLRKYLAKFGLSWSQIKGE